mmetsp:Transcript_5902/g.15052  ORF Transcript_5902/g.15052 Transcript_5902/m.15052 type:complete len:819 (-) Transcript_5902:99-2555(-)
MVNRNHHHHNHHHNNDDTSKNHGDVEEPTVMFENEGSQEHHANDSSNGSSTKKIKKRVNNSLTKSNKLALYDVDGDGKLDEFEKQIASMDPKHTGHLTNVQVYEMLKEQKALHEKVFSLRRIIIGVSIVTFILACSNLATGWATASLAKDTKVDSQGHLVDKETGQVIKTLTEVNDFRVQEREVEVEVESQEEDDDGEDSDNVFSGRRRRRRRSQEIVTTTANTLSKAAAVSLYDGCGSGASLTRTTQSGEQSVALCPADAKTKTGTNDNNSAIRYSYTKGTAGLTILCPEGNPTDSSLFCTMSGSALSSPIGGECRQDSDCADVGTYCFLNVCSISDGTTYYFDFTAPSGGSGTSPSSPFNEAGRKTLKKLKPGDTMMLIGEITNPSYNPNYSFGSIEDDHIWHGENTLYFRFINGEPGRPITITGQAGTVIKGDGDNLIRVSKCSYLRFTNLDVQGEVESIPYNTAKALQLIYKDSAGQVQYRVDPNLSEEEIAAITDLPILANFKRPSYTDTRGFYADNSHHLVLENSHIHHSPGNGVRFAYCEYVDMLSNEVDHCSVKSYSGTMGVTPTYIYDKIANDPAGTYRMRVLRNKVHHNYNEIFSWAPSKTFITPHIDEGKGISCERCNTFENGGRALFANNLVYWNGFSGLNSNDGHNLDFIGNTAYFNSYTASVWLPEKTGAMGTASRGGITFNEGTSLRMFNNIAVCDTETKGICFGAFREAQMEAGNNLQFGIGSADLRLDNNKDYSYANVAANQYVDDPKFMDPTSFDFRLLSNSPALGLADPSLAQLAPFDLYQEVRDPQTPDLGAIEQDGE